VKPTSLGLREKRWRLEISTLNITGKKKKMKKRKEVSTECELVVLSEEGKKILEGLGIFVVRNQKSVRATQEETKQTIGCFDHPIIGGKVVSGKQGTEAL